MIDKKLYDLDEYIKLRKNYRKNKLTESTLTIGIQKIINEYTTQTSFKFNLIKYLLFFISLVFLILIIYIDYKYIKKISKKYMIMIIIINYMILPIFINKLIYSKYKIKYNIIKEFDFYSFINIFIVFLYFIIYLYNLLR